ncbi:MAG: hypothetical protein AAB480_03260 [Patescibacteria group bacterium]
MKKLAVVASGWHFPIAFFEQMKGQKVPEGWQVDMYCVSHRDPSHARTEKKEMLAGLGFTRRELYDRILYRSVASVADIEALGWRYVLEPNSVGDWGNSNQWLAKNDYKQYDKFLFTHDDNFILTDQMFEDLLPQTDWLIATNSTGHAQRRLRQWLRLPKPFFARGSFELFTREAMDIIGGSFDLSRKTLTREGKFDSPADFGELSNWNENDKAVRELVEKRGLLPKIKSLSPYYRMSKYCLEGERGYIHKTERSNTREEEKGLDAVERHYASKKVTEV